MPDIREKLTIAALNLESMHKNDGTYNTDATLESAQIEALALLKMGGTLDDSGKDVANQHYFSGLKLHDGQNFDDLIADGAQGLADGNFNINKALETVRAEKPAYININAHNHHAIIKLSQDPQDKDKMWVSYYNPMMPPAAKTNEEIDAEVTRRINDPNSGFADLPAFEKQKLVRAGIIEEEQRNQALPSIGKDFATYLLKHLKGLGLKVGDAVIDDSQDHQHKNCCGPACADYIAGTTPGGGMSSNNREKYYVNSGQILVDAIVTSQKMDDVDRQVQQTKSKIVENLLEVAGIEPYQGKSYSPKEVFEALRNTGLLEEKDFTKMQKELSETALSAPAMKYSYLDIERAISRNTTFAKEQAVGHEQVEARKFSKIAHTITGNIADLMKVHNPPPHKKQKIESPTNTPGVRQTGRSGPAIGA